MSRPLLCVLPALSTVLMASSVEPRSAGGGEPANEPGVPALFSLADFDGDGRLDIAAVGPTGTLQLLVNTGDGSFEDVTEKVGLLEVENAALALWADYDGDGWLDLFVGAREGASRLFHNERGAFVDMSAGSGLVHEGAVQSAQWLDLDGDGRLDLFVAMAEKSELFRGLEGGFFERAELPLAGLEKPPGPGGFPGEPDRSTGENTAGSASAPQPSDETGLGRPAHSLGAGATPSSGGRIALSPPPTVTSVSPLLGFTCASAIVDQANPGACIQASTTPTLGKLYPISANLFVAVGGNVGIGTTTPSARLEVAGTARVTNTLTLAPSGDQALNVSTGSIYKSGALFIHTKGTILSGNTALGLDALGAITTGKYNTAGGYHALFADTTGNGNTASGFAALRYNTSGSSNTASGHRALFANTTGRYNTAVGDRALTTNTTGSYNTATGRQALDSNTTGLANTANGYRALLLNTTGSGNTASGTLALRTNSTGSNNAASGHRALFSNTTGSRNMASGAYALYSNTTGFYNTANGHRALFSSTSGSRNMASGAYALFSNTTGYNNTANGFAALRFNTTGCCNTATGIAALRYNTTGGGNTATGLDALFSNTTGSANMASGEAALLNNTTGLSNTASGAFALSQNTIGSRNIALGYRAGQTLTTGNNNIAIGNYGVAAESATIRLGTAGTHTRAFLAGIRGVTTGNANAIPVLIDSAGQLGTISSSRRFKEEIRDMGDATERLLELRPVTFRYKPEVQSGERPVEYGLIAEEVAEVFPDLVVYDDDGKPFTVKYHLLSSMLLNELEKLSERHDEDLRSLREEHGRELAELRARLVSLEERSAQATSVTPGDGRRSVEEGASR